MQMRQREDSSNASRMTDRIRIQILDTLYHAGAGHYGGALSCVEILQSLLTHAPIGPRENTTDVFILSKGHAAVAYYATLNVMGRARFDLTRYGDSLAGLEIHPSTKCNPWVHFSTGSLGQGLSYGLGAALAIAPQNRHVWVVMGDGECQEGQVWEAAALASRYALHNLHVIIDNNHFQECGWQHQPDKVQQPLPNAEAKWQAFGWQVAALNGQSLTDLEQWITHVRDRQRGNPQVAIANTTKGAGIPFFEQSPESSHCTTLSEEHYYHARNALIHHQAC